MNYSEMAITVTELNKYIKDKFEKDEYLAELLIREKSRILKIITQVICILH